MSELIERVPDIRSIPVGGKRVLLRASLNLPLVDGAVADDLRMERAIATIRWLMDAGAKLGIMGHLGRKGETLKPIYEALREHIPHLEWAGVTPDCDGDPLGALGDGGAIVFENVRQLPGETKNDPELAKKIAALGDIFVNDAFADSHREHASVTGVAKLLPSYAGIAFFEELKALSEALTPARPALFIVGGAKFETKGPLIRNFLEAYDHVLVGGALANDFVAASGRPVGKSLVSEAPAAEIRQISAHPHLLLPTDAVLLNTVTKEKREATLDSVGPDESIMDVGPATIAMLQPYIDEAAFILWNGPLGAYEDGFADATEALAKAIARSKATIIVGGGDTVAAIRRLNIADRYTFLSTAGGAMIDFLSSGTLAGIEALVKAE